jgi:hypothetical protein
MSDHELIPDLPQPWLFEGYRRVWEGARPTALWQARAVNPLSAETDLRGTKVDHLAGIGRTLEEARDALLDAMKVEKPES